MSENQLPTQEDLQRLYDKRGHGAVITYAYRNALRLLPFLVAKKDLNEVDQKNMIGWHYYDVLWGLLLIQWVKQQTNNFTRENTESTLRYLSNIFDASSASARMTGLMFHYDSSSISHASYASCFASKTANAFNSISASRFAIASIPPNTSSFITVTACKDFNYLQQGKMLPSLWYDNKPQENEKLENKLIEQLIDLGLDFLANDIKCLWEDKPLEHHATNYTKKYSATIIYNIELLKLAVLGELQTNKLTAIRVLLLGAGGAGKTTLANRLNDKPINEIIEHKSATVGINYHNHQAINLEPFGIDEEVQENLQLYLWDFGGQSIFHGLHSAFLHENCVYIIVVDSRHEQSPDEWLYQIQSLVGNKNPPVLIVTNIYENCNVKQNETRLLREFPNLLTKNSFYYFPCDNPQENHLIEFDGFINELVVSALRNQRDVFSDMITIKNSMAKVFRDDVFISQNQLIDHIKTLPLNTPVEENKIEDLMEDLRSLGFIVRLKEKSDIEQYCLKPEWTVDKAYTLLHKLRETESNGLAIANEIDKLIGIETSNNTQKLLDFLIDRKLCYLLGQDKNKQYFFPDASSTDEPEKVKDISYENNRLQIRFSLPYMPLGLHARLVSKFFDFKEIKIQSPQDVWREGFIIKDKNVQAVVSYYYRKSYVDFIFTGDIKHAEAIFDKLYKEIANCLNIKLKEPNKQSFFNKYYQKILSIFNKKDKNEDNSQIDMIVLSIISNDNKLTHTFSELPKLRSYEDLRTAEKLKKMKQGKITEYLISIILGIISSLITTWILN